MKKGKLILDNKAFDIEFKNKPTFEFSGTEKKEWSPFEYESKEFFLDEATEGGDYSVESCFLILYNGNLWQMRNCSITKNKISFNKCCLHS